MNVTLFRNANILTMTSTTVEQPRIGSVGVVGNTIAMVAYEQGEIDNFTSQYPEANIIDCLGCVVMPGLINTHTHVSMTLMRNMADDMELMEWLNDHIWPFEGRLTEQDVIIGAEVGMAEMIMGGTTTLVDMYWMEYAVAEAAEKMGIRAVLAESVLDGRTELFTQSMTRLQERIKGSQLLSAAVGPHAPYTCSPQTIKLAVDWAAENDLSLTIHLAESPSERTIIEERYGKSPLQYLDELGAITPRSILAHSIHLTSDEIERLAQSGASVAHNVQSNMKLASGIAPIAEMVAAGVNCSIATDSASSNNDLDMWEEMRTATLLQRIATMSPTALPAYQTLWLATRGGAKALGMDDKIGEIAVGKQADIIVVDCMAPHMRPRHNLISAMIYCAKSNDVRDVMIGGKLQLRDRVLINHDIEQILSQAERCVEDIKSRSAESLHKL